MIADLLYEAGQLALCGLMVASAAMPIGLIGWAWSRRRGKSIIPKWRAWRVQYSGLDVLVAFLVIQFVIPAAVVISIGQMQFLQSVYGYEFPPPDASPPPFEASAAVAGVPAATLADNELSARKTVRMLWVGVLSLPLQISLLLWARRALYPGWGTTSSLRDIPSRVSLAVLAWGGLAAGVLIINMVLNLIFAALEWTTEQHPLTNLPATRPTIDRILFVLQTVVAAPIIEEVIFRGIILPWVLNRPKRVWALLVAMLGIAMLMTYRADLGAEVLLRGPMLFAIGLFVGWLILERLPRGKQRTIGAIYATAALFAAMHSSVWPTPIPLFVLGLGLGYLAVRTRGVVVPAIVHGLFNAISTVYVLTAGL